MDQIKSNDTITIKLMSGEEVVTRLVEELDDVFVVSNPMAVVNLQSGIGLGPYVFTAQPHSHIPIVKKNVVSWCLTENNMARKYAEGTTGLKLS
jgi:hypothetical protein